MKNLYITSATLLTIAFLFTTLFSGLRAQTCNQVSMDCSEVTLDIQHISGEQVYEYRFTVSIPELCGMPQAVSHVSFGLPQGAVAAGMEEEDVFYSPLTGTEYEIENTSNNPFYSIKFNVMEGYEGIKRGERETFVFKVSEAQGMITEFPVEVKIANNSLVEDLLVDVDCMEQLVTLPIELVSFRGEAGPKANNLSWLTASEENNEGFAILHSTDGKNFERIGWVAGAGTTNSAVEYSFSDFNFSSGVNYYQLEQVDFDGKKSNSDIISIENEATTAINVFPNPVSDVFFIQMDASSTAATHFELKSSNGQLVKSWEGNGSSKSRESVDMTNYPAGMYFLTARSGGNVENIQIVKTK